MQLPKPNLDAIEIWGVRGPAQVLLKGTRVLAQPHDIVVGLPRDKGDHVWAPTVLQLFKQLRLVVQPLSFGVILLVGSFDNSAVAHAEDCAKGSTADESTSRHVVVLVTDEICMTRRGPLDIDGAFGLGIFGGVKIPLQRRRRSCPL